MNCHVHREGSYLFTHPADADATFALIWSRVCSPDE